MALLRAGIAFRVLVLLAVLHFLNVSSFVVVAALADLLAVHRAVAAILGAMQTVVLVRRLHDVGRSGWWVLLAFTIVGIVPLFVWSVRRGDPHANRFDIAPRPRPAPAFTPAAVIDRFEQLAQLRRSGVISEDEYQTLKKAAL